MNYDDLEKQIGYKFQNKALLVRALTHRSFEGHDSYERLEFLGDRVLALAVATTLYKKGATQKEGEMTKKLIELVRRETLESVARDLALEKYFRHNLGAGGNTQERDRIGADCCEALLGAVFLDSGWQEAEKVTKQLLRNYEDTTSPLVSSARGRLQEWSQQRGYDLPEYVLLEQSGDDHAPLFKVRVIVNAIGQAEGQATTKKRAYHRAAQSLMKQLSSTNH